MKHKQGMREFRNLLCQIGKRKDREEETRTERTQHIISRLSSLKCLRKDKNILDIMVCCTQY